MSRRQLQVLVAAGLAGLLATAAQAQQRNPIFVVSVFHSQGEPKLGMEVAEAFRERMSKLYPQPPKAAGLRVIKREEINSYLSSSSFPTDSALSPQDLQNLGKLMGATETFDGTVVRTAVGIRLTARFYFLSNIFAPEVLPAVEEKDVGAAARKLADLYAKARNELADYDKCRIAVIGGNSAQAIVSANAALKQWDKGVLPLGCLMTAYQMEVAANRMAADSLISVGEQILRVDPDNEIATVGLINVYRGQGKIDKWMSLGLRQYQKDPSNTGFALSLIDGLAASGAPERAMPIANELRMSNPGDAGILQVVWKLNAALSQWREMISVGREMVRFDSSLADSMYFRRQTQAARADSQPALVLEFLGAGLAKFPKDALRWLEYSQELRRAGRLVEALAAAKRAVALNPQIQNGNAITLYLLISQGQRDSAIAFAKRALSAGGDSAAISESLIGLIRPAMDKAQASNARADWQDVLAIAATIDSSVPAYSARFYAGVAAANIGLGALEVVGQQQQANRALACTELKIVEQMFARADDEIRARGGGRTNPTTAGNLLTVVGQQQQNLPKYRAQVCRPDGP